MLGMMGNGPYELPRLDINGKLPIGSIPTTAALKSKSFIATASQTVFSIADTGSYTPGTDTLFIYVGGTKKVKSVDFTETSSTSFTMTTGVSVGVRVEAVWFQFIANLNQDVVMKDGSTMTGDLIIDDADLRIYNGVNYLEVVPYSTTGFSINGYGNSTSKELGRMLTTSTGAVYWYAGYSNFTGKPAYNIPILYLSPKSDDAGYSATEEASIKWQAYSGNKKEIAITHLGDNDTTNGPERIRLKAGNVAAPPTVAATGYVLLDQYTLLKKKNRAGTEVTIIDDDAKVYQPTYNDLAEFMTKGQDDLEPGDVLIQTEIGLMRTSEDKDGKVIGVYSDTYGYTLGGGDDIELRDETMVPVGLTGRVLVKVSGEVRIGDLLVTSYKPGVARAINKNEYVPGTVFAKALENSDKEGRIWALIMNS